MLYTKPFQEANRTPIAGNSNMRPYVVGLESAHINHSPAVSLVVKRFRGVLDSRSGTLSRQNQLVFKAHTGCGRSLPPNTHSFRASSTAHRSRFHHK